MLDILNGECEYMKKVGFIGPSGTGKSHRAAWVAKEHKLDFIIDDGLLIKDNRVIAGQSAKKENTRLASVRRALFIDEVHAEDVRKALDDGNAGGVLILGTSDSMVEAIAKKLGYEGVDEKVYIQDVANESEINQAIATRREQGKHVIPVPTFEIKKDFSGYFLDPLQIFRRRGKGNYQLVGEKSVVRPTFSYMGNYTISDYTIFQLVEHVAGSIKGISKIARFRVDNRPEGILMDMDLIIIYGHTIPILTRELKTRICEEIEKYTALNIRELKINIKSLVLAPDQ